MKKLTKAIIEQDKQYVWHPFTPSEVWMDPAFEPVVIERGEGSLLFDTEGREYLDGNSSIWTNIHGHNHPTLNKALTQQLGKIAHASFLGLTNTAAPKLAKKLCQMTTDIHGAPVFSRAFFSDDGSTAMETALKALWQYLQQNGQVERKRIISLASGYHGDTIGAMSLGHSKGFHSSYQDLLFESEEIMSPGCYRCPYNTAEPEQADARSYRKCNWECIRDFENTLAKSPETTAGYVLEPRVQGPAGFVMHPEGFLEKTSKTVQQIGGRVILDEVMVGMGRTGKPFAFQHENIQPDLIALAKGLSGGYLPVAATLVKEDLFQGFQGELDKVFYHGHSYTGNPLGCATALESCNLLTESCSTNKRKQLQDYLHEYSQIFWECPNVGDVRQEGLILAIELVKDTATREPFPSELRLGAQICQRAQEKGLLTRPVINVLLIMPPYSTSPQQLQQMVDTLYKATVETLRELKLQN